MAYKGWFLLQKYFVLFCSKSFSYEWTCYSYYLLSDTSWTPEAAHGRREIFRTPCSWWWKSFLSGQGFFFSFSFPLPEERPPCFLELKVSRQGLSGCAEVRRWRTHTQVVWCVAEGVLWHVKAGAPGWRWNCSLFSEPLCLQRLWAAVVYHTFW